MKDNGSTRTSHDSMKSGKTNAKLELNMACEKN